MIPKNCMFSTGMKGMELLHYEKVFFSLESVSDEMKYNYIY